MVTQFALKKIGEGIDYYDRVFELLEDQAKDAIKNPYSRMPVNDEQAKKDIARQNAEKTNVILSLILADCADLYVEKGQPEKAREILDRVSRIEPQPNGYIFLSGIHKQKGRYKEAIEDLGKAIKLNDKIIRLYWLRIDLYLKTQEYENAIADYESIIKLTPQNASEINKKISEAKKLLAEKAKSAN